MIYVVGDEVSSKIATNDVENFEIDDGAAGSSKWHLSMDLPAERLYHGAGVVNQEVRKATHRCLSVSLGLLSLLLAPRRRLLLSRGFLLRRQLRLAPTAVRRRRARRREPGRQRR